MQSTAFVTHKTSFWLYFVTLSDEHKLRLLENKVLRGVFGTVRDDVGEVEMFFMKIVTICTRVINSRRMGCARTCGARNGDKTYCGTLGLRDTKEILTWESGV
jgi:hypothetical protein